MPNPRQRYLYPKISTYDLIRDRPNQPKFDFDTPSPLSQAVSRRLVEMEQAEAKAKDMKLSPLDRAVAGLEAVAMAGSGMFEAIQQAPKLLQGEDAYAQAIGNRMYQPRVQPEKSKEYVDNALNFLERLQTEYKLPPILPEVAGFQPLVEAAKNQAVQGMKRGALQAGTAVERALDKPVTDVMNRGGFGAQMLGSFNTQPAQVIKPKGGNWLADSAEKALEPLRSKVTTENFVNYTPEQVEQMVGSDRIKRNDAINQWIDRNLTNYVKKEMATPEDPVRKLAEQGITHFPIAEDPTYWARKGELARKDLGGTQMAQSDLAKQWENRTDPMFSRDTAQQHQDMMHLAPGMYSDKDEWIKKLAPETNLFSAKQNTFNQQDLGFDHIVDVLKQDLAEGRIRPEQLNKVSMEQAVRRTYEYDQEMAKKMAEAQLKATEGMPVHKEYPEEGFKWVELTKPNLTDLPEGHRLVQSPNTKNWGVQDSKGKMIDVEDDFGGRWFENKEDAIANANLKRSHEMLKEALKYEGDTMGHCVGGYCPDVLEGRSRIFSLRDKRGEPHVTIEVEPAPAIGFRPGEGPATAEERFDLQSQWMKETESGKVPDTMTFASWWRQKNGIPEPERPMQISQIKGKQNAAPKADYLPYVQDFVKSGNWSHVGDIQNTGMRATRDIFNEAELQKLRDLGETQLPHAMTGEDIQRYHNMIVPEGQRLKYDANGNIVGLEGAEGMKAGGKVHISDNPDTMAMELDDQKFQVGGIVDKAVRLAKAAKAAEMKQAMKASEALAKIEGKRLNITQADRTKVGQGFLGGPGFSGLQLQEGPHKDVGAVWGVKNVGTAKTMLGGFQDPLGKEYFTTMIGSPTQHQSNQMVFDKLYSQFKSQAKKGNLDPELRDKINARLAAAVDKDGNPVFPSDVDILSKDFKQIANTFDRRAIAGNLIGGTGVGGKKGQIIDYDKIIRETTDPYLLDAPSGSLGYRLWTPSGEIIERPDLHPAFPAIATGEDLGVEFTPAAQDILMEPWVQNIRETKGRNPGYMDWTRGRPPSVEVTEDILTNLQKSGNKAGGLIKVKRKAGGGIIKKAIQAAGKAAEAVAPATKRLEMSFKDVAKPVPELTEAAQKLKAGQLSREEYEALVNQHKPVTPYSFVPQPATAEDATRALNSAKREKYGKTKDIPAGTLAGLRLDIPAYKEHGVWVNSIHPENMPTVYSNVSSVTDAEMIMPEEKALEVATREKNKSPFAVIKGGWNPITEEEAVAKATEYLNHPEWVQVGIDPERHGYYYNRATMEPIVKADEVIQIGPLVLAKNPVTAPKEAFKYARGGAITGDDLILTERPL
jgi:hypothetical protein